VSTPLTRYVTAIHNTITTDICVSASEFLKLNYSEFKFEVTD